MKDAQKTAVILSLIERLEAKKSWCGETHIQKAVYFMESLFNAPLGFDFVLYKHGPYSFELSDHISEMRGSGLLKLVPQPYPYGPSLSGGESAEIVKTMYPKTIGSHSAMVEFVAGVVGAKGVSQLEVLATALYVTSEIGMAADSQDRARRLVKYKPHVDIEAAAQAVREIDKVLVGMARNSSS